MALKNNFDEIIREWFFIHPNGFAEKPYNKIDIAALQEAMKSLNYSTNIIQEVIKSLNETDIVKNKKTGNVYTVQNHNPDTQDLIKKDASDDEIKKARQSTEKETSTQKQTKSKSLKQELIDKKVKQHMDADLRITNLEVRAEIEYEDKVEQKKLEELSELRKSVKTLDGSFKDRAITLVAIGHLYGKRNNSGFGKNMFGQIDRDQLELNKETLLAGYDDAIPEKVEKFVRGVRNQKVSEEFVERSFNTLPKHLQAALSGKGKVGDKEIGPAGGHFLGYKKQDGSITSDANDPDINKDENGKLEAVRGKVPNKNRAKLVWRMYLEQGGIDAYTGLPLDIEEMDLEHVVGFKNSDKGEPTTEDYANREHEANHVLTSSKANQNKSDMSMKEFFEKQVDPLKDKTPEEFTQLEKGVEKANEITPRTEQTALRLMDDIKYKLKGGGTTTDANDPNVDKTDLGTPKPASATLSANITPQSLQEEFSYDDEQYESIKGGLLKEIKDPSDSKKIKGLKSKIGKRTINAMGLPGGIQDPSGRRTNSISGSDNFYRGFLLSMAGAPSEEKQKYKQGWHEAAKLASSQEVRAQGRSAQSIAFVKHLREKGLVSDEILNNPKYGKLFKYKNKAGEVV